MNRSFVNLFEKYNITYSTPRNKQKNSRTSKAKYAIPRNTSAAAACQENSSFLGNLRTKFDYNGDLSENLSSTCYLNTSTTGKYNYATRYKTLEVIGRKSLPTGCCPSSDISNSIAECSPQMNQTYLGKENDSMPSTSSEMIPDMECSPDFKRMQEKRRYLSSSFNIGKRKLSPRNSHCSRYNKLNVTLDKAKRNNLSTTTFTETSNILNDSFNSCASSSPEPSQIIETPTTTQESVVDNVNSELDLLLEAIERENQNLRKQELRKQKVKDRLSSSKKRLKGGYEELFERALKRETVRSKFLKHDRKFGLRTGELLTVVDIETGYGLTVVVVNSSDSLKNFGVVVGQEMVAQLKLGSQIEAYFDDNSLPYKLPYKGDYLDIYLEPYKIFIV